MVDAHTAMGCCRRCCREDLLLLLGRAGEEIRLLGARPAGEEGRCSLLGQRCLRTRLRPGLLVAEEGRQDLLPPCWRVHTACWSAVGGVAVSPWRGSGALAWPDLPGRRGNPGLLAAGDLWVAARRHARPGLGLLVTYKGERVVVVCVNRSGGGSCSAKMGDGEGVCGCRYGLGKIS